MGNPFSSNCTACGSGRKHTVNDSVCKEKQEKHYKALTEKGKKVTEPKFPWFHCEECLGYGVPASDWYLKKQGSCQECSGTGVVEKCDCGEPLIETYCGTCWMLPSPQMDEEQRLIDAGREKEQDAVCPAKLLPGWEAFFDKTPCSSCKNERWNGGSGMYGEFAVPKKEVLSTRIAYKSPIRGTCYETPKGKRFCGECYNNWVWKYDQQVGSTIRRRLASSSNLSPLILLSMLPLLFLVYWFVVRRFTQPSTKAGNRQHMGEAGNFTHPAVEPALDMV